VKTMQQTYKTGLSQKLRINPKQNVSLHILSASCRELEKVLNDYALNNPLIEVVPPYRESRASGSDDLSSYVKNTGTASLDMHLIEQLELLNYKGAHKKALYMIIDSLDENGFFKGSLSAISKKTGFGEEQVKLLLREVKKLDPPGIGAKDYRESIMIQLKAKGLLSKNAKIIIQNYLDYLARENFAYIEHAAGIGADFSKALLAQIKKLNPYPAKSFCAPDTILYIEPDIIIDTEGENATARLNPDTVYKLKIDGSRPFYRDEALSAGEAKYILSMLSEAKWLEKSVQKRYSTLLNTGKRIAELQRGFFLYGSGQMVPLSKKDVAQSLGVHPSTVTRALCDKYIKSPQGIHPASFFFSGRSRFSQRYSPLQIKQFIKKTIGGENAFFPESDGKIAAYLSASGIGISRRTVAKYRLELGISPASIRRKTLGSTEKLSFRHSERSEES